MFVLFVPSLAYKFQGYLQATYKVGSQQQKGRRKETRTCKIVFVLFQCFKFVCAFQISVLLLLSPLAGLRFLSSRPCYSSLAMLTMPPHTTANFIDRLQDESDI